MLKRRLLPVLALLSLAPMAYGQATPVSETTVLQNIAARDIPTLIKSVSGLDQLTCNFHDNSVIATGAPAAVASFEKELHAADVQPAQFKLVMRLVRYHVDKQGKSAETVVSLPTLITTDKAAATISVGHTGMDGYAVKATPEGTADKSVNLAIEVQELGEQGEVMESGKNTQIVPLGKTVHITGMTDAADKALRRAVQRGEVVTDHGEYTGYYLEVTPSTP